MNKAAIIISVVIVGLLAVAIPAGIYLSTHPQILRSRAQENPTPTNNPGLISNAGGDINANATTPPAGGACQTPETVQNVLIEYPYRSGNDLNFNQASCTWDSVSGATSYNISVTEVDSNTVIKTDSISASTTSTVFNVTQNKTYKCDITAVNSCGQTGGTGTHTLLCQVDGILATPTPSATPVPTVAPTPPPVVSTPAPTPLSCGYGPCSGGVSCGTGMTCVTAANGSSYCAMAAYANNCRNNPSYGSCCTAPVTTLPKSGDNDSLYLLIGGGLFLLLLSGAMLKFAGKR